VHRRDDVARAILARCQTLAKPNRALVTAAEAALKEAPSSRGK